MVFEMEDQLVFLMSLSFPEYDEQHYIASFFKRLDSNIAVQQKRLDRLKQMKTACLDSMFPHTGGGISRQ